MSKVVVDRELLERIVNTNMADYAVIAYQHKEIRGILAQPAEAEGVRDYLTEFAEREVEAKTAIEELQDALSAVTAERDRLRKDAERWRYVSLQGDDTHWLNLLRVDLEDFGGNINAAVDALIDGEAPAMAAKEAGTEHVCSGCGAKGWTGNCLECIPY